MSDTTEAWPGQEVVAQPQWPGQEVKAGQGEHGYAAAPPETPKPAPVSADNPDFLFPTEYGPTPTDLPKPPDQPPLPEPSEHPDLPFSEDYGQAVPPESARQIVGAMGEGWQATPSILTPEGEASQERLWGPYLGGGLNLLYRAANVPFAAGNALIYGGAELANQITGDPRAGRDFIMGAQIAPTARTGLPSVDLVPRPKSPPVEPPAAPPRFVSERFAPDVSQLDPRNAIQTLIQHDIEDNPTTLAPGQGAANQGSSAAPPAPVTRAAPLMDNFNQGEAAPGTANQTPPPAAPPAPQAQSPGPQSLGAAASRDMTDPAYLAAKTPAQALNDFRTSVMQTARDRANPGETPGTVEDHTVYVPGVQRLVSARVFDPEVAGNHDTMMDIDKAYETAATKQEQDNHDILKDTFLRQAGDTNSVAALEEQRDAVSPDALGVFQNERPVSAQPVVDTIQEIKDSPAWKVDAVRNVMQRVEKGLYDANGNLETMPSQLYGARQNLTTIRDSNALTQEASDAKAARYQLGQVLAPLDQVIGEGSNGYKDIYLPQWADYSRQIDQQRYLQSKTIGPGKVTGADHNLTANGMQKLLEQIAVDKGKRGNNAAKTLTDPQLDNLVAIRNELAAMQFRDQLAKSSGSPTVKKAAAAARLGNPVLNAARETAIHGVLAHTTGGAGNVVYQLGVKPVLEKRRERKAESIMTTARNRLLSTSIPTD